MSELQTTPDSSKDLEKDEREAMEQAWPDVYIPPTRDGMSYEFEEGWIAAKAHFEARLQQVEAERDEAIKDVGAAQALRDDLDGLLTKSEAELSIAREALGEIRRFSSGEGHAMKDIARTALANTSRLQAKEEGT